MGKIVHSSDIISIYHDVLANSKSMLLCRGFVSTGAMGALMPAILRIGYLAPASLGQSSVYCRKKICGIWKNSTCNNKILKKR